MRNKIFGVGLILSLVLVLMMASVNAAACTFVTPGASAKLDTTTEMVNVTCTTLTNVLNCTVSASSALQGDSLATTTLTNITAGAIHVNATFNSVSLEDATDWVFAGVAQWANSGACYNATQNQSITARTGILVDNTKPTAPSTITPTSSEGKDNIVISSTVVDATTTACTMTVTSQIGTVETYTMDYATTTCSDTISFNAYNSYSLALTASDGTNTTTAASQEIVIKSPGSGGGSDPAVIASERATTTKNNALIFVIIGGALLLGYTQGWFGKKGKK